MITFAEMLNLFRRYFVRLLAVSLAVAMLTLLFVESIQTYTCTLNYRYNYGSAESGYAPDDVSPLDPYEIQNPMLIRGALNEMGYGEDEDIDVEKVRNNIVITEIVEDLEQEISDSAALLGEKYTVEPVEFKIKYTYSAGWGSEFGTKFFDRLIGQYDRYLLATYYNKKEIPDFAKILDPETDEYINMADSMSDSINDAIEYLEGLAEAEPEFRSKRNGYSFADLALLYSQLRDIQYAKYYGNIRSGNLARDPEMVIKSYSAQVEELTLEKTVEAEVADEYFAEIIAFYDGYKKTPLYNQAQQTQSSPSNSNNRHPEVLNNFDIDENYNTYDHIVLKYTEHAEEAARISREIDHRNLIIDTYLRDEIKEEVKAGLIQKNETIFAEIAALSAAYSELANTAISEHFAHKVNDDLLYLITTDVQTDKPTTLIVGFAFVLCFGLCFIGLILLKLSRQRNAGVDVAAATADAPTDALQQLFLAQSRRDFREMHMTYQPMIDCRTGAIGAYEAYIRWDSAEAGYVSPAGLIACAKALELMPRLNAWVIEQICANLAERKRNRERLPVIHINCPNVALQDFGITDLIVKYTKLYGVDARNICMEIDGPHVVACLSDILLLQKIGVKICIDRFETSEEKEEIISAITPDYIKLSASVLGDADAAVADPEAFNRTLESIRELIARCETIGIKPCISGIENELQEELLVNGMQFVYRQGYRYGRPEPYVSNATGTAPAAERKE